MLGAGIRAVKLDDSVASKNAIFTCLVAVPPTASLLSEPDNRFFLVSSSF
jgi:hypothetical protein